MSKRISAMYHHCIHHCINCIDIKNKGGMASGTLVLKFLTYSGGEKKNYNIFWVVLTWLIKKYIKKEMNAFLMMDHFNGEKMKIVFLCCVFWISFWTLRSFSRSIPRSLLLWCTPQGHYVGRNRFQSWRFPLGTIGHPFRTLRDLHHRPKDQEK